MSDDPNDLPEDDVDTDPVDDDKAGDDADLGDAGKKALDAMKAKWRTERDARKALAAQLAAKDKPVDDDKPDLEALRTAARDEARAETLRERVLDKIEAKAARLFADPEDAVALLGRRADDFIDDGKVDVEAISEGLTELLGKKPHLAATAEKRFAGSADGGARKGSKPDQLTRQDLKRMTPAQIVKAQEDGRLGDLLGVQP